MPLRHVKDTETRYLVNTYKRYDVLIERGSGAYLFDRQNRRYLDLLAGIGVNALGYNHPRMLRVLRKQIKRPLHVSNLLYHEYQGPLARRLAGLSGLDRVFFSNSGAEAVEACLKFARIYANRRQPRVRRYRVLAVEGSFHGRTLGALSATSNVAYREPFEPLVPGFERVRWNDPDHLDQRYDDDVAAVILEAVQGEGGVRSLSEEFYRRARELTRASGAALIADEVQCGLGRTGRWMACHKFANPSDRSMLPDLIAIAKPLGGGLPLGASLLKEEAAEEVEPGDHGSTFGGGPLACRLSLELLRIFEEDGIVAHAHAVGAHFLRRLSELAELPAVQDVRGEGLMLAVELKIPGRPIVDRLLREGYIVNCTRQTVLRLLPPLILQTKQADKFVTVLRGLIEQHPA